VSKHAGRLAIAVFVALLGAALVVGQSTDDLDTSTDAASDCSAEIFTPAVEQRLLTELDGLAYAASAYDTRSGCWFHLNPDVLLTTASAIKLQVLAANLDRAERLGRDLTQTERESAARMLWFSHNSPPTSELYVQVGAMGMAAFSRAVGANTIEHTAIYGITWTPASDLTRSSLATLNLEVDSPLSTESRTYARQILSNVHDSQRWGISAGLPADHSVWLKNGFYPCRSCRPFVGEYTWRASSTGYIERPDGTGWALTVLTDGSATQAEGMAAVEVIASIVSGSLADGEPAEPSAEPPNCTTVTATSTTASLTAALAVDASEWSDVRWVSGNEGPLLGQLVCAREPLDMTGLSTCICPSREGAD